MNRRNVILIAEDVAINREMLSEMFEEQYEVQEAENGQVAIDYLEENHDRVACLLLDLIMPVKTGFDVMDYMTEKNLVKTIPVILITGDNSQKTEESGYNYGVSDIIYKPFEAEVVMRRVKNVVDLYLHVNHMEELVREQTKSIEEQALMQKKNNELLIDAIGNVLDFRIKGAKNRIARMKKYIRILLKYLPKVRPDYKLNPERIDRIVRASGLYDIGKLSLPDALLSKAGKLTASEEEAMREHTTAGCEILELFSEISDKEFYQYCYDICRYHHERWDGNGYPERLAGDRIPIPAQLVAIANAYDSLVAGSGYYTGFTPSAAINEILSGEQGQFSPTAIECLKLAEEEFRCLVEFSEEMNML